MNKTELIVAVAKESEIKKSETRLILESLLNVVMSEVAKGERVQLTGFGIFERKERGARNIRNPRTGENIKVPPSKGPTFTAGSIFREKVNV